MSRRRPKKQDFDSDTAFLDEGAKFAGLARQAAFISNRIGRHVATPNRGYATWLFMRAGITAQSIVRLLEPQPSEYGNIKYLDQASIASLCRALIETAVVQLYIGDINISEDEWKCRKHVIDIHDYVNRSTILAWVGEPTPSAASFAALQKRL